MHKNFKTNSKMSLGNEKSPYEQQTVDSVHDNSTLLLRLESSGYELDAEREEENEEENEHENKNKKRGKPIAFKPITDRDHHFLSGKYIFITIIKQYWTLISSKNELILKAIKRILNMNVQN